jgi:hypothetical protein
MPCSDSKALDYLNDHRTKGMMKDISSLEKRIDELESLGDGKRLAELESKAAEFAKGQNRATKLLCTATNILALDGISMPEDLQAWYDEHVEHDVTRMLGELEKILNHKTYGTKALAKWLFSLSVHERMLFNSRSEFSIKIEKTDKK